LRLDKTILIPAEYAVNVAADGSAFFKKLICLFVISRGMQYNRGLVTTPNAAGNRAYRIGAVERRFRVHPRFLDIARYIGLGRPDEVA
jgi:hypothetical protein